MSTTSVLSANTETIELLNKERAELAKQLETLNIHYSSHLNTHRDIETEHVEDEHRQELYQLQLLVDDLTRQSKGWKNKFLKLKEKYLKLKNEHGLPDSDDDVSEYDESDEAFMDELNTTNSTNEEEKRKNGHSQVPWSIASIPSLTTNMESDIDLNLSNALSTSSSTANTNTSVPSTGSVTARPRPSEIVKRKVPRRTPTLPTSSPSRNRKMLEDDEDADDVIVPYKHNTLASGAYGHSLNLTVDGKSTNRSPKKPPLVRIPPKRKIMLPIELQKKKETSNGMIKESLLQSPTSTTPSSSSRLTQRGSSEEDLTSNRLKPKGSSQSNTSGSVSHGDSEEFLKPEVSRTTTTTHKNKLSTASTSRPGGVAFGTLRGECSVPSCECKIYTSPDNGKCKTCSHFPAQHIDLGRCDVSNTTTTSSASNLKTNSTSAANISNSNSMTFPSGSSPHSSTQSIPHHGDGDGKQSSTTSQQSLRRKSTPKSSNLTTHGSTKSSRSVSSPPLPLSSSTSSNQQFSSISHQSHSSSSSVAHLLPTAVSLPQSSNSSPDLIITTNDTHLNTINEDITPKEDETKIHHHQDHHHHHHNHSDNNHKHSDNTDKHHGDNKPSEKKNEDTGAKKNVKDLSEESVCSGDDDDGDGDDVVEGNTGKDGKEDMTKVNNSNKHDKIDVKGNDNTDKNNETDKNNGEGGVDNEVVVEKVEVEEEGVAVVDEEDEKMANSSNNPSTATSTVASKESLPDGSSTNRKTTTTTTSSKQDIKLETQHEILSNLDREWLIDYNSLKLISKLGNGVSSHVYKGIWNKTRDIVAIKILKLEQKAKDLNDFKKELYIMSQLRAPNIVHFYGATLDPKLCIVMELCVNGSLFHYMKSKGELSWDYFFKWSKETAKGMNTLHLWKPQIVHRDLKTLNLLLDQHYNIKICDFGLSRYTAGNQNTDLAQQQSTEDNQTLKKLRGTYAYTAPEMYYSKNFTTKSDVFSIGIVMWEMLMCVLKGKHMRPYSEYTDIRYDYQIIYQVAQHQKRPTIPTECPDRVSDIIKKCWSHEPDDRPSCAELLVELQSITKAWDKKKN
eukprot:TRINITY_DN5420_c0_g1_i2.p1 TRINITY_DN5420_c0_g1~~TRINITY_DN5420_c0_g1_i2.p1  ORF type:complete len:1067 (+),score=333.33 TRINITY_DN5420_c0_g1_i2:170-3370(+)